MIRRPLWLALPVGLAATAALLHASPARGYAVNLASGGALVRWAGPTVDYYLQEACSADVDPAVCLAAVRAGFESWTEVECATIGFAELGDAPNPKTNLLAGAPPNGKNEVVWIEDATWTFGKNVLGVTAPLHGGSGGAGAIYEADIAFNGYLQTWSVEGGQGAIDIESVAVHEIGHMIGIQHNLDFQDWQQPPTMAPNIASKLKSRTLEDDDRMAVCFLYPEGGAWACESDADCPNIMSRDGDGDEYYSGAMTCALETKTCGAVSWVKTGIANLGEACDVSENCVGDYYCQPWEAAGGQVCAQYCLAAAPDCPVGFTCHQFTSYPKWGTCLPTSGEIEQPGEGPAGCASSDVCAEGKLCLPTPEGDKKACTVFCDVSDAAACPEGQICWQYSADKPTGGCFPAPVEAPEPEPEPDAGGEVDAGSDVAGEADTKAADVGPETDTFEGKRAAEGCGGGGSPVGALGWVLGLLACFGLGLRRRAE